MQNEVTNIKNYNLTACMQGFDNNKRGKKIYSLKLLGWYPFAEGAKLLHRNWLAKKFQ